MADSSQEKTELATQRRLDEASEKGQVPISRETTAAILFLAVLGILWVAGGAVVERLNHLMQRALRLGDVQHIHRDSIAGYLTEVMREGLFVLIPLLLGVLVVVLLAGFVQVGFALRWKKLEPDFSKLDPLKGAERLVSLRSVVALLINIAKVAVVGTLVWFTIEGLIPKMATLGTGSLPAAIGRLPEILFTMGFRVAGLLAVLAAIDLAWQRYRHGKDLMMTKEEVREDRKRSEGDPRIKGRIRQIQRQMARARMMQDVKSATFVIRNPTHYAVALRYDRKRDPAPRVVAKGKDLIAKKIIEIAENAGVPVRSDPPLARQLHGTVAVGQLVPEHLFAAVAKVLAWVMKRRGVTTA